MRELEAQRQLLEEKEVTFQEELRQLNRLQEDMARRAQVLHATLQEVAERERRIKEDRDLFFPIPAWLEPFPRPRFAVAGEAGTGKSSFINRLAGLDDDNAPAAAPVDAIEECTMRAQRYEIREGPFAHVNIFDLPGMGTHTHPEATYVSAQGLLHFDGLLIFHVDRPKRDDINLFRMARRNNIKWYLVRHKMEDTMQNDCRTTGRTPEECLHFVKESERGIIAEYLRSIHEDVNRDREQVDYDAAELRLHSNPMGYDDEELKQQLRDRIFCLSSSPRCLIDESMRPAIDGEWERLLRRVAQDVEENYPGVRLLAPDA